MTATANIPNALRTLADHLDQHPLASDRDRVIYSILPQPIGVDLEVVFYTSAHEAALEFAATLTDHTVEVEHFERDSNAEGYWSVSITGALGALTIQVLSHPDARPGETIQSVTDAVTAAVRGRQ